MYDVVAIGELLIDFACQSVDTDGYPTMAAHPGGAPANFLAALSRFGAKTALLGKVGKDAFGHLLTDTLQKTGIDTKGIVKADNAFTTLAFVTFDSTGDRAFSFARKPGADTQLCFDELNLSMIDETRILHFGTLSLTDEPARSATYQVVTYAKQQSKLITFDPNLRKPLWRDLNEAKTQIEWGLSQADVVKISEDEVKFLWDLDEKSGAKKIMWDYGVKLVFVTCGVRGCWYQNPNAHGMIPALSGIKVIDTTGAGDIFGGSAVWKLLQTERKPEELKEDELCEIVTFACTAAGLSTTKSGGISSVPAYDSIVQNIKYAEKTQERNHNDMGSFCR